MSSTVVTRVLRAMRNSETATDGGGAERDSVPSSGLETTPAAEYELVSARAGADLQERLAVLEQRLDVAFELIRALRRERDELRKENAALAAALAEHGAAAERVAAAEQALAEQTALREELEAEVRRLQAQTVETEPAEPEIAAHLAFVSCADGYRLVECPGPPPAVGSVVELPGETGVDGRHLVVRVGEASLPGPPTLCAYLLPVD